MSLYYALAIILIKIAVSVIFVAVVRTRMRRKVSYIKRDILSLLKISNN